MYHVQGRVSGKQARNTLATDFSRDGPGGLVLRGFSYKYINSEREKEEDKYPRNNIVKLLFVNVCVCRDTIKNKI